MAAAEALVAGAFPDLAGVALVPFAEQGWDFHTFRAGDVVFRFPRFPESAAALRAEIAVLPALAPHLPAAIPVPSRVAPDAAFAGYRFIDGSAMGADAPPSIGAALGRFLRALHALDPATAGASRLDAGYRPDDAPSLERLREAVLPLLEPEERRAGVALFDEAFAVDTVPPVLRHSDLGPEHVLVRDGALAGIIDWGDLSVGDRAIDLAWALCGTDAAFADAVVEGYGGIDDDLRRRAAVRWAIAPWHEVAYGLRVGEHGYVESGLHGVRARLRSAT